jgi:hypothetical protein
MVSTALVVCGVHWRDGGVRVGQSVNSRPWSIDQYTSSHGLFVS